MDCDLCSIQRDIDDIRAFLDEQKTESASGNRTIEYDRNKKGYVMTGGEGTGNIGIIQLSLLTGN